MCAREASEEAASGSHHRALHGLPWGDRGKVRPGRGTGKPRDGARGNPWGSEGTLGKQEQRERTGWRGEEKAGGSPWD